MNPVGRGQPRNGFTLALDYVSETVFQHRMFVVLGIESKSQSSSEKTWLGIIGLSNFLIQPYSFPVGGPLHLGTQADFAAKHRCNAFALSHICVGTREIVKYLGFKGISCCMQMKSERRHPHSVDKASN